MNHLLKTEYISRWKEMSDKELVVLQDSLVTKINAAEGSTSVVTSLTQILEILETYMQERDIF